MLVPDHAHMLLFAAPSTMHGRYDVWLLYLEDPIAVADDGYVAEH